MSDHPKTGTLTDWLDLSQLIDIANWNKRPIRFLIVDLALVGGLDMSSAEAFVRVQRLLAVKRVTLIICGVAADSAVGRALQQVDVWADRGTGVEVFATLNEAMECKFGPFWSGATT
jgi:SulP family sulfate permease